jgi:hypothetical protein
MCITFIHTFSFPNRQQYVLSDREVATDWMKSILLNDVLVQESNF